MTLIRKEFSGLTFNISSRFLEGFEQQIIRLSSHLRSPSDAQAPEGPESSLSTTAEQSPCVAQAPVSSEDTPASPFTCAISQCDASSQPRSESRSFFQCPLWSCMSFHMQERDRGTSTDRLTSWAQMRWRKALPSDPGSASRRAPERLLTTPGPDAKVA